MVHFQGHNWKNSLFLGVNLAIWSRFSVIIRTFEGFGHRFFSFKWQLTSEDLFWLVRHGAPAHLYPWSARPFDRKELESQMAWDLVTTRNFKGFAETTLFWCTVSEALVTGIWWLEPLQVLWLKPQLPQNTQRPPQFFFVLAFARNTWVVLTAPNWKVQGHLSLGYAAQKAAVFHYLNCFEIQMLILYTFNWGYLFGTFLSSRWWD